MWRLCGRVLLLLGAALCRHPEEDRGAERSALYTPAPTASAPHPHPHKDYGKRWEENKILPLSSYQTSGMRFSYNLSISVSIFFLLAINMSPNSILIKLLS